MALFLALALLFDSLNTFIIVTDFIINQDIIAKTLCIQKEEQQGCNGKCHLRKELNKTPEENNKQPFQAQQITELSNFIITTFQNSLDKSVSIKTRKKVTHFFQNLNPRLFVFNITHPPEIV